MTPPADPSPDRANEMDDLLRAMAVSKSISPLLDFMKSTRITAPHQIAAHLTDAFDSHTWMNLLVKITDPGLLDEDNRGSFILEFSQTMIGQAQRRIDRVAHQIIEQALHRTIPEAIIVGEEATPSSLSLEPGSIIIAVDPIDGTVQATAHGAGWSHIAVAQELTGRDDEGQLQARTLAALVLTSTGVVVVLARNDDGTADLRRFHVSNPAAHKDPVTDRAQLRGSHETLIPEAPNTVLYPAYKPIIENDADGNVVDKSLSIEIFSELRRRLPGWAGLNAAGTPMTDRLLHDPTLVAAQPTTSTLWDAIHGIMLGMSGGITVPVDGGPAWTDTELWAIFDQPAMIEVTRPDPFTGHPSTRLLPNKIVPPFVTGLDVGLVGQVREIVRDASHPDAEAAPILLSRDEELPPGKYEPLTALLDDLPGPSATLAFAQLNEVIDGGLPTAAYQHRAWWSNAQDSHPQAQAWATAGWQVASVDLAAQIVTFTPLGS